MATNAIRLLTQQHRDIEKWFEQLAAMRPSAGPTAESLGTRPREGWPMRATTDSGEEIRESAERGLWVAGPDDASTPASRHAGIPRHSELSRTASPVPSETDGRTDDSVPGQEFRDLAGHHPDGKTHVGMDDDRVRDQMIDATSGRPRPEGMIGQGRENLAGVRNQFDSPQLAAATTARASSGAGRTAQAQGAASAGARAETMATADTTRTPAVAPGEPRRKPLWTQATPDPYEVLLSGHDLDHKRALTARLFDALTAHRVIEEQLLYPAARPIAHDLVEGALESHREMREIMDEIRHTDPSLALFDHLMEQLQRLGSQHVRNEEQHLFPRLHERLGSERLEELGMHMQERFRVLIGLERRFSVQGLEGVDAVAPPGIPPGHVDEIDEPNDRKPDSNGHD